jgi:MarR family transcriptional regulator, organic hydroperoxide resistance regulator
VLLTHDLKMDAGIMPTGKTATPTTVTRQELLVGGKDAEFRDLLSDIFAFSQRLQEARERFARFIGLSAAQYMILIALDRFSHDGEAGINQIAAHLRYSGAFVTIEVNGLVKAGLVTKEPHLTDGRRVVLHITALGLEKIKRLAELQRPVNDALFETLSAGDFAALRHLMQGLAENSGRAIKLATYLEETLADIGPNAE